MSDYIPTEIITNILARLPVKSLLHFTPVCKLWYVIITNPKFIATHFNQFGKTSDQLFYRAFSHEDFKDRFFILPHDENFNNTSVELDMRCTNIVGTCSGLICLIEYKNTNVIIWNPCLRKPVTLTLPQKSGIRYESVIGFGFDLRKNIFKVVIIMHDREHRSIPPDVVVYEQGMNRWKGIKCALLQNVWVKFMSQLFLNGAVHWVAYDHDKSRRLIIAFEMDVEVFRKIPLPLDFEFPTDSLSVTQFKDSLAVLSDFRSHGSETITCSVWWMRNYGDFESWTKLYNIRIPILCWSQGGFYRLVGLRKNSDLLFQDHRGMLVSYEPGTETVTPTGIRGSWTSPIVVNFVESLVLLKEGKDVPDWLHNFVL